ncbi:MAG: ADP-ribosylglycohydrolase family protein [Candidatus Nanopelagicales bacterium]
MALRAQQIDRAEGALVGTACGDALGAGLEFKTSVPYPHRIAMAGDGILGWKPGEWTDDTSMAIIIASALAEHGTLTADALDSIAKGFEEWARTAPDVGSQTREVMRRTREQGVNAVNMLRASREYAASTDHADGNGSLMRTAPVALAYLDDVNGMVQAARVVSALTHAADDSTDACVLWCSAIQVAVMDGTLDGLRAGLEYLAPERRDIWKVRLDEAEGAEPWDFPKNGWVVHALQAAWAAITCKREHEGVDGMHTFERGVDHAVRCGNDTDTVGAIAGGLLGAVHGLDAVPKAWFELLHGWPGLRGPDLVSLTDGIFASRQPSASRSRGS